MPYSSEAIVLEKISDDELVGLTDDANSGSKDSAKVDAAIAEADEIVDAYVGKVKAVPLSPVPGLIEKLSATIAIWKLHERRGAENEVRERAYDGAIKTLEKISKRIVTLGEEEAQATVSADAPSVAYKSKDAVFTESKLSNF